MSRIGFALWSIVVIVSTLAVYHFEAAFVRPSLSARPQIWLSQPVNWLFETDAQVMRVERGPQAGMIRIDFQEPAANARRAKEFGRSPLPAPIQTNILFTTLREMDITPVQAVVVVPDLMGQPTSFAINLSNIEFSESALVLEGSLTENPEFANGLIGATVRSPGLQIWLPLGKCEPRESRVACPLADFSGADLSRGDFELANLRGADFTGATMAGSKLGGADLSGAVLFDADLSGSWLVSVNIDQAFLENTLFTDAVWTR
jgi:hypothetical protein